MSIFRQLRESSLQEFYAPEEISNIEEIKTSNDLPFKGRLMVKPSPTADTRSAEDLVSEEELEKSTKMHIQDVKAGCKLLADELKARAENHDQTKLKHFKEYFAQFRDAQVTGQWSLSHEAWEKKFHLAERHHLKKRVPDDVDLLDVLEMISDCVVAALARSGEYHDEPFDALILKKAYDNTIKKLIKATKVTKG